MGLLAFYLFLKYIIKKERDKINKNKNKYENFASMKPYIPVKLQTNYTNYVPDYLDVSRLNGKYISHDSVKGKYVPVDDNIIGDDYAIDLEENECVNGWGEGDRKITGIYNDYIDNDDTQILNPLNEQDNYLKSTCDAVQFAAEKNRKNLIYYV